MENEPLIGEELKTELSALYRLPNVFLTPHIAGAIGTERSRLGNLIVDEIERFIAKAPMLHQVAQSALTLIA